MDNLSVYQLLPVVLGMALVTYTQRLLPLVFLNNLNLPPFWDSFFRYIPFAALGALIVPGIFNSTGSTASALAGTIASAVLAYFRVNLVLVVIGGVLGVLLWELM